MKKPLLYLISALTIALTGCVSNAARDYKNDKEVQSSITNQIVEKGKETYYIELEPDIDNIKFGVHMGIPLINDNQIIVPVKTKGKPVYTFKAKVNLEDNEQTKVITSIDIGNGGYGMGVFEEYLLSTIFSKKHEKVFEELKNSQSCVIIHRIEVSPKRFDDLETSKQMKKEFATDYEEGRFANTKEYDGLLEKYMKEKDVHTNEPYYPEVTIELTSGSKANFNELVHYVEKTTNLPYAEYSISMYSTLNRDENYHEIVLKNRENESK
ncbi:hypothetical protein [Metabacillus malikii]|uniref:DUF1672 family protein n=1 Tax=Metabacillus malikii TaxID=1504265 RepID=A0ABT9ZJJ5_9BACI|nr:hypothetical protein [Metabacillus malikii]MDQ0232465.1 hypothetical protein [Metabacillus malikii]